MKSSLAPLLVVLAAFAVSLTACGDAPAPIVADDPNRVHVDDGFSFVPPPGWEDGASPVGAPAVFMTGEVRGDFRMNLNVNISELPATGEVVDRAFLEKLAGQMVPQYESMFAEYSLIEDEVVQMSAQIGLRMSSKFEQGVHKIANVQYMFPLGQKLFVFTYTCRQADWDEQSPIFRTSGESIRFD